MRKLPRLLLLSAILAMLLCVSAFAADQGIYGATAKGDANVSFQYYTANDTEVTAPTQVDGKDVYADAVKIKVTYTGTVTANAQYLFVAQNAETTAPTSQTIVYIDQNAAQAGSITFTAYPRELTSGKTYHVYLASSDTANGAITTLTEIAEYSYYAAYTPGDVDDNGTITITDAQMALEYAVRIYTPNAKQLAAGDIDGSGVITVVDAQRILERALNIISSF